MNQLIVRLSENIKAIMEKRNIKSSDNEPPEIPTFTGEIYYFEAFLVVKKFYNKKVL